jgi:integrase/recombinase XerD
MNIKVEYKRKRGRLKERKLQVVLTEEEVFRLFGMASSERDRLLLKFLYYTGMRVNEVINIKKEDINFKESVIRIRSEISKTRTEAMQPIPKLFLDDLKRYVEYKQNEDKLFPLTKQRVWQLVKHYTLKAKINKNIHPHTFRHTYGTHLYERTNDLGKVQELLRHQSLATTGIYKHLSKELKQKTVNDVFK